MHYLAVTGKDRAYIAVLIGNQDFQWKRIDRDENALTEMIRREVEFWNEYVITKKMPGIIKRGDTDTLDALFPTANPESEIVLPEAARNAIELIESYKSDLKNLEGLIETQENELKMMIGENSIGLTPMHRVAWLNCLTKRLDTQALKKEMPDVYEKFLKATNSRRFIIKPIKNGEE